MTGDVADNGLDAIIENGDWTSDDLRHLIRVVELRARAEERTAHTLNRIMIKQDGVLAAVQTSNNRLAIAVRHLTSAAEEQAATNTQLSTRLHTLSELFVALSKGESVSVQEIVERAAETSAIAADETIKRRLLRKLVTRFSDEELQTLTFDLNIDYDTLPGRGKQGKARELLEHVDRRNSIELLVLRMAQTRPDVFE